MLRPEKQLLLQGALIVRQSALVVGVVALTDKLLLTDKLVGWPTKFN